MTYKQAYCHKCGATHFHDKIEGSFWKCRVCNTESKNAKTIQQLIRTNSKVETKKNQPAKPLKKEIPKTKYSAKKGLAGSNFLEKRYVLRNSNYGALMRRRARLLL